MPENSNSANFNWIKLKFGLGEDFGALSSDAVLTYGPNEKLRSEYFLYGTNNWLVRALLYSHHEVGRKFSEN